MLERVEISNFTVAKDVALTFRPGLTVITGETGAGKSILMNALAIVLGARADAGIIRHQEDRAEIQAELNLPDTHAAHDWLRLNELDDDGHCSLRRVIPRDRASRAFINGRSVSASMLRELGGLLIDIHSQNEHQSLLGADTQRDLLDSYAQISAEVHALSEQFDELATLKRQLATLTTNARDTQDKLDLLNFQLQELETFAPEDQEWEALEQAHRRIHHLADVTEALGLANELLSEGDNAAIGALSQATQAISKAQEFEPRISEAVQMLEESRVLLDEASQHIQHISATTELDEAELSAITQRFSSYMELSRKHRIEPQALYAHYQDLCVQQSALLNPEDEQVRLQAIIDETETACLARARRVSTARTKAAKTLSAKVSKAMQKLGMEGGYFKIELNPHADQALSRHGLENTAFRVSTNKGMPDTLLSKTASGGELSRISLALQVIISDSATVPTLVFDEVDVGIGGKTAATVGQLLHELSRSRQIICITHLAQVAARGDQHMSVSKTTGGRNQELASAQIFALDASHRVEEIARMVGGKDITESSLQHAKSLMEGNA